MSRLIDVDEIRIKPEYMHDICGSVMIRAEDIARILNDMPTIEPKSHWISCKERLPENYVDVLVWFEYYRYGSYNRLYRTHGIGTYSENYDSWTINHESGWHKLRVIAWQPLPEPYQPKEDES